jgi:hypothetical protein
MAKKKNIEHLLIYGTYSKILHGGRLYGGYQTGYRIMASSWLLATFAAIGFLLSNDNILPFEHILAVPIISFFGIVGLYLIWHEDTFVQEILLDVNVVEGLELEKKHPWLPQVHHNFLNLYKTTNARFVKVLFFIGCKSILFLTMGISLAIFLYPISLVYTTIALLGCIGLNLLSNRLMIRKAGKIQELMEHLSDVDERS